MLPLKPRTIISKYTSISQARAAPLRQSHRSSMSTTAKQIICSQGEDEAKLKSEAVALTTDGKWQLIESGKGFERTFRFKSFKTTWDFMNTVAAECKAQKHHPEWSNVYNKTQIRWTTHRPDGLSSKDVHMARFCDRAGAEHGELLGEGQEGGS